MMAQAASTLAHIPILATMLSYLPEEPVLAIALATSTSSLIRLISIIVLGLLYKDVRESWVTPSLWPMEGTDFIKMKLPSMVMYCAQTW